MTRARPGNSERRCSCSSHPGHRVCRCYPGSPPPSKSRRRSTPSRTLARGYTLESYGALQNQLDLIDESRTPDSTFSLLTQDTGDTNTTLGSPTTFHSPQSFYDTRLSPVIATPTNSDTSSEYAVDQQRYHPLYQLEPKNYSNSVYPFAPQAVEYSPPLYTDYAASLAGINNHAICPRVTHHVGRPVEFVSPHGPYPSQHQQYPPTHGPWNCLPLRQHDSMLVDEPISLATNDSPTPPTPSQERNGKRVGPLGARARKKANDVRAVGACLRCQYMKESCNLGDPCGNCESKQSRKWKLGCVRGTLESCLPYLFPEPLKSRYSIEAVNRAMDAGTWIYSGITTFQIRLDMGVPGGPLVLDVREIDPINVRNRNLMRAFQAVTGDDSVRVDDRLIYDPPILPYIDPAARKQAYKAIGDHLQRWLNASVFRRQQPADMQLSWPWPWPCFEVRDVLWGGDVLDHVHDYFRPDISDHIALRDALCLPFWTYVIGHPFEISQQDLPHLLRNLAEPPSPEFLNDRIVCPEEINRFLKTIVFKMAMQNAETVIKNLHQKLDHMARNGIATLAEMDVAFCLAFILILFVGKIQAIINELGKLSATEMVGFDAKDAEQMNRDMETKVAHFVIHFHAFAVKKKRGSTSSPSSSSFGGRLTLADEHAARHGLMQRIKKATSDCSGYPPGAFPSYKAEALAEPDKPNSFKIGDIIGTDTFGVYNAHRLCWKLYDAAYGD